MASPEGVSRDFDLLTIGDCTVDIFTFPEKDKTDVHCQLHGDKQCELCLATAAKITSKGFNLTFGGNAANVAVGASRLGLKTAIYTHVGDDLFGKEIMNNFKKEGVDTSLVEVDKKQGTNVNIVISSGGERTIITKHQPRRYEVPSVYAPWTYFSSLAPDHGYFHEPFLKYVKESRARLVFNPGSYQIREGLSAFGKLLKFTEALVVNRDEAGRILGIGQALKSERKLLSRLRDLGPRIAVVTDGPNGAYASGEEEFIFQPATKVKAIERTGAGDAFSSGLTSALALEKPLREALKWGTINAESVTQQIGAQGGLLKRKELEKKVSRLK
ncbi:MAG: ribokinase [Patescibacteria group bacterium]|nr:MAG: ribokinase [Patescibacteria group bacterium]